MASSHLVKIFVAVVFFAWMAHSGRINLHQVVAGLVHYPAMLAMLLLLFLQPGITAWRWNQLLKAQRIRLPYQRAFGLTMIGLLFNVATPGAVSGDVLKGYYLTRATGARGLATAVSLLMDRVLGLLGIFLLAGLMVLTHFRDLIQSPGSRTLGLAVVVGWIAGMCALYTTGPAGVRMFESLRLPRVGLRLIRSLSQYHKNLSVIPISIAASVLSHLLSCLAYYIALRSVAATLDLSIAYFFLLVPLGFVATALPVSPAGIGIGQAAFFALFRILSAHHASAAANAFTVYQLAVILVSLSGFYWYFSYKEIRVEGHEQSNC